MFNSSYPYPIIRLKINGIPKEKEFNTLPFGRQLDYKNIIKNFKDTAKKGRLELKNLKNKSYSLALKNFIKLYEVKEYYFVEEKPIGAFWEPDSVEIYYK